MSNLRLDIATLERDIANRFWAKVDRSGGPDSCWIWTACKDRKGYGMFKIGTRAERAHRVVHIRFGGNSADVENICHRCDNPSCVNPAHLFGGTSQDNTLDAFAKGRRTGRVGVTHHKSKLTELQVHAIRSLGRAGKKQRDIAALYGVSQPNVWAIINRRLWTHLPEMEA